MTMDLETARAVVEAENRRQNEARNAQRRELVGRFFKYHNSSGAPEKWWMYGAPRKVSEWGRVTGLTFQHMAHGTIEIDPDGSMGGIEWDNRGSWQEITAAEFWRAAKKIAAVTGNALRRRGVRSPADTETKKSSGVGGLSDQETP